MAMGFAKAIEIISTAWEGKPVAIGSLYEVLNDCSDNSEFADRLAGKLPTNPSPALLIRFLHLKIQDLERVSVRKK